jgi:hypothetical protein
MENHLFIDQDISELRGEIQYAKAAVYKRLYDQCRRYADEPVYKEQPHGSVTFMGIASANLSLIYLLTRQPHYLEEAKRWIFACVEYPHWGTDKDRDVDLSAAWILFGSALSYDWLKNALSEGEKTQLKDKIILQATRMYDYKVKTEGRGWSTNYWQNHNWINLTGLAAAGYALVDEYPQAQAWIDAAKENFDIVFAGLPEDGSDFEGVVYWRYGAMWLFVYAHLLKEREGVNYFTSCDFLKNTFYYRLYQSAPNLQEQINFGDCHDRFSGHSTAIYYKTAAEYQNGHAQKLGNLVRDEFLYREAAESKVKPGILPECLFEMIFFDPVVQETDFDDLPLTKYFDDLGLVVIRSSWEKDAIHFSFKSSHPGGKKQWQNLWKLKNEKGYDSFGLSHQHPDNNSFILVANDTYLAIDDGYNRTVKAADHNVVLVDGMGYQDENQNNIWREYLPDMVGEIEKFVEHDSLVYVVGETARAYQKSLGLKRFARHVLYTHKSHFIIFDELLSDQEHEYTWLLHSDVFPTGQSTHHFYQNGPAEMRVYPVFPENVLATQQENIVKAVMTKQEPENFCQTNLRTLSLKTGEKSKQAYFLNIISVGSSQGDTHLQINPIQNETTIGIEIHFEDESEIFLYSPVSKISFEDKQYDTKELFLRQKDNHVVEEILL